MGDSVRLSIVVPMFSSQRSIVELVARINSTLSNNKFGRYEIILVNDGSPDDVVSVVREELMGPELVLVDLMRNYGQINATLAGLEISAGEIVVTMDDDLQFPPEEIPNLLKKIEDGNDVVYGIPIRGMQSYYRSLGSKFINLVYRRLFSREHERSSFAAMRRPIVEAISAHSGASHFTDGLIVWYTNKIGTVPIKKSPRAHGKSGWKFRQLLRAGLDMITNYSRSPLLISAWLSFGASIIALLLGSAYIIQTITLGNSVPGWASIFVAISFFSSVQLFTLGIMGEYVARLQINSNQKPKHFIRSVERGTEEKD